jgi:hypothetical protein
MKRNFSLLALCVVALTACSDSDSTGPETASLNGRWTYNASNISGGGMSCNITGVSFTLTQSGNTFTGTTLGGAISCSAPGVPTFSDNLGNDVIANGTINGTSVTFDIGTPDIHHTGAVSGSSMNGVVVIRISTGASTITLSGNFSAVKT